MALFWALPWVPYVVINGPRQAEAVLKSSNINKSREYSTMRKWLGIGLVLSRDNVYRAHRRILTPTFHFGSLNHYLRIFLRHGERLAAKLVPLAAAGEHVPIWPLFNMCTLDSICEAIIGRHFDAQGEGTSPYAQAIESVTRVIRQRMQMPWWGWERLWVHSGRGREEARCLRLIHAFGERAVRERLSALAAVDGSPAADEVAFLDSLAHLADEGALSRDEIRMHLDNFIFGGHDTTTMALNWTIFMLGHHTAIQRRVQVELDEFVQSPALLTVDTVKNLKYLECCIKESLRLFPPVPIMGRVVESAMEIDGVTIPIGTTLATCVFSVHRDPEFWPDPHAFDPDRFLPHNVAARHPFAYIPFSAGTRNCIGQKFAMLEIKAILAVLLSKFDVESVESLHEVQPVVELMLRPSSPINLRLKLRSQHLID